MKPKYYVEDDKEDKKSKKITIQEIDEYISKSEEISEKLKQYCWKTVSNTFLTLST